MTQYMAEKVAVTAIVPCFCCAATLARAMESIAEQTALPKQVILIDDNSQDGGATLALMHELRERCARQFKIEIIQLPKNVGVAAARNAGWEKATEPYIAFLDSDDAWHSRKLEMQYATMRANPDIALCGHRHLILKPDVKPNWAISGYKVRPMHKLAMLLSNPFITPAAMIRTDIPFRFLEGRRYMEDHLLWLEMVSSGLSVVLLEEALAATYKRPFVASGLSNSLWQMERAELENYRLLRDKRKLSAVGSSLLMCYSMIKFCRRIMIYAIYQARMALHFRRSAD